MTIDYWQEYQSPLIYHIYNRSSQGKDLFLHDSDYQTFLSAYTKYFSIYFKTYAYCLMPNHYHFLVCVQDEDEIKDALNNGTDSNVQRRFLESQIPVNKLIEDQFRRFHSSYSLKYNAKYRLRGQLFMNRHKHVGINEDHKLKYLICYIHHNPIHHGFVRDFTDWKYTSFHSFSSSKNTNIYREEVLSKYGGYQEFLNSHIEFRIEKLRDIENL